MGFEYNNKLLGFMKVLTFFDQLSCQLNKDLLLWAYVSIVELQQLLLSYVAFEAVKCETWS